MWDYDRLFEIIEELVMHHSPSGVEAEINQLLMQRFAALVLLSQDAYGIYDEGLNGQLRRSAKQLDIPVQLTTLSGFGSDASIAMKFGMLDVLRVWHFPPKIHMDMKLLI
jgi:putative aminopeptidase FrvX